jgi:hypothetical protein
MTAADPSGTGAPHADGERDALGWFCFVHHLAVMIYIVVGWLIPSRAALVFYVAFLPAVVFQWRFNKDSCIFNNVESLIRTGQWRDPANREEGAWLLTLARDTLGLPVTPLQVDIFTYAVMALLWLLGVGHMLRL